MSPLTPFFATAPILLELPSEQENGTSSLAFRVPAVGDRPAQWFRPLSATDASAAELEERFLALELKEPPTVDQSESEDLKSILALLRQGADAASVQNQAVLTALSALAVEVKKIVDREASVPSKPLFGFSHPDLSRGPHSRGPLSGSLGRGAGILGSFGGLGGALGGALGGSFHPDLNPTGLGGLVAAAMSAAKQAAPEAPPASIEGDDCTCPACNLRRFLDSATSAPPAPPAPQPEAQPQIEGDNCDCPACNLRRFLESRLTPAAADAAAKSAARFKEEAAGKSKMGLTLPDILTLLSLFAGR